MFEEFENREGIQKIKEHLRKVKECREAGIEALQKRMESVTSESVPDIVMLAPGTMPFEWDVDISATFKLGGRTMLVPVQIPEYILISFDMKKEILQENDKDPLDIDKHLRGMLQLIVLRGIASFIKDEDRLRERLLYNMLHDVVDSMKKRSDDDDGE